MWHPKVPPANLPASKVTLSPRPPAHNPPSPSPDGPLPTVAPCCPDVAIFEKSTGVRSTYFGYDNKTNLVANRNADEYWIPPDKPKRLPSDKKTPDDARWVSVGVGQEAQVQILFGGKFSNRCLSNCSYEVDPPHIAEVTSPANELKTWADFKIRGKAVGEASVKVMCNGSLKGYFHIWCEAPAVIRIGVGTIKVTNAPAAGSTSAPIGVPTVSYSIETIKSTLDEIYRQAVLSFSITDLGTVDFDGAPANVLTLVRDLAFNSPDSVFDTNGLVNPNSNSSDEAYARWANSLQIISYWARRLHGTSTPPPYMIWFLAAPTQLNRGVNGLSIGIPGAEALIFRSDADYVYTIAHELGHMLGLHHLNDKPDNSAQFPAHLIDEATNIQNWDSNDPLNLMGEGSPANMRTDLHYLQWDALSRQ